MGTPSITVAFAHMLTPSRFMHPLGLPRLGEWGNVLGWKLGAFALNRTLLADVNRWRVRVGLPRIADLMRDGWSSHRLSLLASSVRARLAFVLGFVSMGAALASSSCTSDMHCPRGYASCDGNVVKECIEYNAGEHHKASYASTPCSAGTFCVVDRKRDTAFCSLTTLLDPLCTAAAAAGRDLHCDGKAVVRCSGDFPTVRTECSVACVPAEGPCVDVDCKAAVCAASADADPRCPPHDQARSTFCDGASRLGCEWGHVLAPPDDADVGCAAQSACVDFVKANGMRCSLGSLLHADTRTGCALSIPPARDSRCTPDVSSFCEGNALLSCSCGYLTSSGACPAGERCTPQRGPTSFALCTR